MLTIDQWSYIVESPMGTSSQDSSKANNTQIAVLFPNN